MAATTARESYVKALKLLGHYNSLAIRKSNGSGFYAACECGYQSTTRRTLRDVVETIEHHRKKIMIAFRASGLPIDAYAARMGYSSGVSGDAGRTVKTNPAQLR